MDILFLILGSFFGTILGFSLLAPAFGSCIPFERKISGFFSTIFLIVGLGSILWIACAPAYHKETAYPIYRMDNATVLDNTIVHEYYLGYVNDSGTKVNVTSFFNHLDVDPSKYEAIEINKTGYSGGIYWEAGLTTTVHLKTISPTIESK